MSYAVGDTVSFVATFRNPDGSAATGLTVTAFSKDAYTKAGASITFPTLSAFAEIGVTGRYRATAVAAAAGIYTVIARATGEYLFPDYECGPVEVVTAAQADPLGASVAGYAAGTAGDRLARIGTGTATLTAPSAPSSSAIAIRRGDDYTVGGAHGAFEWSEDAWAAYGLDEGAVTWRMRSIGSVVLSKALTVVDAETVRLELTDAETTQLRYGVFPFDIVAQIGTSTVTLVTGSATVL
jgi:hypothetical protein